METTEKIVEAYVRYVKGWATIPNIKCDGQYEIDLLAINPVSGEKYHIESGVSVSGSYSKLTNKPYSEDMIKVRVKQAGQRRTLGYFADRKFCAKEVVETLKKYGFEQGNYKKVIVTWDCTPEAKKEAENRGILIWDFRDIISKIAKKIEDKRTYFTDDTLRTLHLYARAMKIDKKQ